MNASMDVEIAVADHPLDYVPMMDHQAVVSFIVLQPPENMCSSGVDLSKFITLTQINPQIKYPDKAAKHKFNEHCTMVDQEIQKLETIKDPVINDESFICHYNTLTSILDRCNEAVFGQKSHWTGSNMKDVTTPQIQGQICHVGGAMQLARNPDSEGVLWPLYNCYTKLLTQHSLMPNININFPSYLQLHKHSLYKELYRLHMAEIYRRAQKTDAAHIGGTLKGGSIK